MVSKQTIKSSSYMWKRAGNFYIKSIRGLYLSLKEYHWKFTASILVTFLTEPFVIFKGACLLRTNLYKKNHSNINPTALTEELSTQHAILLVHGDHSNSGLFTPLLNYLAENNPYSPFFTIDLDSNDGIVSEHHHLECLVNKIYQITSLYPSGHVPKMILIGHSSGGDVIVTLAKKMIDLNLFSIAHLIKIAAPFGKKDATAFEARAFAPIVEIVGTRDVIKGKDSYLKNTLIVPTGHVGILFDQTVLRYIHQLVST